MKYLVDTCGWLEWFTNGSLAKTFAPYFTKIENLVIPTLIQYELYKWVCREKNSVTALEIIGITESGVVIPLDTHLALYAAEMAKDHNLAMADAIIYATSIRNHVQLITCDSHFDSIPGVKYFQKHSLTSGSHLHQ